MVVDIAHPFLWYFTSKVLFILFIIWRMYPVIKHWTITTKWVLFLLLFFGGYFLLSMLADITHPMLWYFGSKVLFVSFLLWIIFKIEKRIRRKKENVEKNVENNETVS